jgi:hypothetical protein
LNEPRESTAKWAVRKPDGTVLRFPNLDVLQSWIREGIVVKGDWIEHEEAGWTRVEAVTELAVMMAKSTPVTKPPVGPRLAAEPVEEEAEVVEPAGTEAAGPPPLPFPSAPASSTDAPRTRKMHRTRPPSVVGATSSTSNVISLTDVDRPSLSREEIDAESESVLGAVVPPALPPDAGAEALLPLIPGARPRANAPRTGQVSARPGSARREPSRADIELQRALIRRGRAAKLRRRALLGVAFVGGLAGLTVWAFSQRGETPGVTPGTAMDETVAARSANAAGAVGQEAPSSEDDARIEASALRAADPQKPSPVAAATANQDEPAAAPVGAEAQPADAETLAAAKAEAAARAAEQAAAMAAAQQQAAAQGAALANAEAAKAQVEAAAKAAQVQAAAKAAELEAAKKAADAAAAKQAADAAAAKQAADAAAAKKAAEVAAAKQAADAAVAKKAADAAAAKKAADAAAAKQAADAAAAKKAADAAAAKKAADAAAAKKVADAAAAKQAADAAVAKKAADAAAAKKVADAAAAKKVADAAAAKKAADAAAAKKAADAAAAKKAADAKKTADAGAAKKSVVPSGPVKPEAEPAPRDVASLMAAAKKKEKSQPVEALRLYREALALSPSNTDVLMAMGRTQIALANIAGAEAYLRKCRAISAGHSGCLYWLGRTLAMSGKTSESQQLFHEYLSRNPDGSLAEDVRKRLGE